MKTTSTVICSAVLLALSGCISDFDNEPPDMQVMRESRPMGDVKEFAVNVKYGAGQFEIMKVLDDSLFSMDLQYNKRRFDPKFDFGSGEHASLRLDLHAHGRIGGNREHENELTLRLSEKVPLDFDVTTGVSESRLDMTGLQVRRLRLRGGVGKTEVTFDKPSKEKLSSFDVESGVGELIVHGLGNTHVERMDLSGGVGRTEIDFTGELGSGQTDASIKVGVGEVRLTIPRDADVEIEAEGSFLSNINAPSFDKNGHTYTHHGDGGGKIRIRVESGVGGVNVDLI